jgi:hypothetical protein
MANTSHDPTTAAVAALEKPTNVEDTISFFMETTLARTILWPSALILA